MLLRYKIPLLGTLTLSTLVLVLYAALHVMLTHSFRELETRDVHHRLQQVREAIANVTGRIATTAGDYAAWDDTYRFMQDRNPEYTNQNLRTEGLVQLRIDLMALFDIDGRIIVAKGVDLRSETDRPISAAERTVLEANSHMFRHTAAQSRIEGLLLTQRGPLLFGSRPIVQTDYQGPILGALVVGKYLDATEMQRISRITHLSGRIYPWSGPDLPPFAATARQELIRTESNTVVVPESPELVRGYAAIQGADGEPTVLLEVSTDRAFYRQGLRTLNYVALSLVVSGTGLNVVLLLILNSQILRRLTRVSEEVNQIRVSADQTLRMTPQIEDELGGVAAEINRMLDALQHSGEALRESEQKFRLMFESAHDAIFWIEPEFGTILLANQRATELTQRSRAEMLGQSLTLLGTSEESAELLAHIRQTAHTGIGFERQADLHTPSDSVRVCDISGALTVVDGKRMVQTVIRDITHQRQTEQQRLELEERLHQSQKMEAIGQLAGGIAHDFNNLLAGISGYADLIRTRYGGLDPKLDRYAGVIFDTSQRAAELTSKLLTFARKGKTEFLPIDMHAVVSDVLRLLTHTVDRRIRMVEHFDAASATVIGDRSQLQNLIMNLALNARDAMPSGGELHFTTSVVELSEANANSELHSLAAGQYLRLLVRDTGIGMDETVLARLFEPFYTTKAPGKGTGLGLASAYGMVRDHNGQITVDSTIGKGTTFHIYLPLAADSEAEIGSRDADRPEQSVGQVLLVDDEEIVRDVTTEMLEELGYTVHQVSDGLAAVAWYREHWQEVDIVVLDMIMPSMSGSECFQELLNINPMVRVLIASGYAQNDDVARLLAAGAIGFLQKPFHLMKLAKALARERHRVLARRET